MPRAAAVSRRSKCHPDGMTEPDSEAVARLTARYPPADISPAEFEEFVAELLGCTKEFVSG